MKALDSMIRESSRPRGRALLLSVCLLAALLVTAGAAFAGDREMAKRMHDRLVGVPPSDQTLDWMELRISQQLYRQAADIAMANPGFYNATLKTFITPWTNEDQTVFAPLNDYSATVIGMIRDDHPFNEVLSADLVYVGAQSLINQGVIQNGYSQTNNLHYEQLEAAGVDLSDPSLLVPTMQSTLPGSQLVDSETGGVITTRAAGMAFFSAGTNRRMWRFTAMNFLCRDMEQLNDVSRPVDRIRQDVTRGPGGDSQIFLNSCSGCHNGMDPLAGAYAYFEWDENAGRVVHTRGDVQQKMLINANVFPFGYETIDNRWDNYWLNGQNSVLGWDSSVPSGGYGVKSLGAEVAASRAFAVCQVEKVFEHICFRAPANPTERQEVEDIADDFQNFGFSMKQVFADVATYCMDD